MATVINNPPTNQPQVQQTAAPAHEGGMGGMLIAIVLIAVLFFLFLIYGLPALRGNQGTPAPAAAPPQAAPQERDAGTTIDIPKEIDVDINR